MWKLEPNIKVLATPSMVQHVAITKLVSPLKGGIGLQIKPLLIQTFTIHVLITNVVNELVVDSKKYDKE